jgi:hypothetical protein
MQGCCQGSAPSLDASLPVQERLGLKEIIEKSNAKAQANFQLAGAPAPQWPLPRRRMTATTTCKPCSLPLALPAAKLAALIGDKHEELLKVANGTAGPASRTIVRPALTCAAACATLRAQGRSKAWA